MKLSEVLALQAKKNAGGTAGQQPPARGAEPAGKPLRVLRTRETPNPNALQFVLNAQVIRGNKAYNSAVDCQGDSLGEALFDAAGVVGVYITENFVTVTKDDFTPWLKLKDPVWKLIDTHIQPYASAEEVKSPAVDVRNYETLSPADKLKAIEMVLDRSIRVNLAKDGGGVDLKGLEGNEILIHYQGACGNCPSSTSGTLQFIEKQFKQQLHPDLKVRSV
jgi:Fe-S cluster biogenesis protein NfuA